LDQKKKKILITDDNQGFILYLSNVLSRMGFQVIPAESGVEVERLMDLMAPDLVVLDADVPGREGMAVLRAIREAPEYEDIPVVMLFAERNEEMMRECSRLGAAEYLMKPLDLNLFHDILQNYLFNTSPRRRKHLRCTFESTVTLFYRDVEMDTQAVNLSEGGIFVRLSPPLPVGSDLEVAVPLNDGTRTFPGKVIYINDGKAAPELKLPVGMAVEFRGARHEDLAALSEFVKLFLEDRD
jgi:DNA-binding response OmpR family regulator